MTTHRQPSRYGWLRDLPDKRDLKLSALKLIEGPPLVNLLWACPPVYDQGNVGSCTANAIAGAVSWERYRQKLGMLNPSRLFIYYNEREIEGTTDQDAGAMIRDGMKTVNQQGVCSEYRWPYDESKVLVQPSQDCYLYAVAHKTLKYLSVGQTLGEIKNCLANGYPFVFGFSVYESFESDSVANTGLVPMPKRRESLLGGHAVMCIGKNDGPPVQFNGKTWPTGYALCRNSWGSGWGASGYFFMDYRYMTDQDLADDFWSVRLES